MRVLKNCDFLGITPIFRVKNKYCHKTIIGAILSVISMTLSISLVIYFSVAFINRKKYSIRINESKVPKTKKFWGPEDFSIIVLDKYFNEIEESDRYFNIYADIWTDKRIELENGTMISKTIITPLQLETCNVLNYSSKKLWINEKLINKSVCFSESIKNQKANSTGSFGSTGYSGIVIWVHLCQNSTNKTNCYPKNVSISKLENIFVYVKFMDYYFDHNSYNNFSVPYIYSELIQGSSTSYKRTWFQFQNIEYKSDIGLIFEHYKHKNFTTLSSSYNSVDLRSQTTIEDSFFVLSLNMDDSITEIVKEYYKFQDLCADLGGILNIIFFIAKVLTFAFTVNSYYQGILEYNVDSFLPKDKLLVKNFFYNDQSITHINKNNKNTSLFTNSHQRKSEIKSINKTNNLRHNEMSNANENSNSIINISRNVPISYNGLTHNFLKIHSSNNINNDNNNKQNRSLNPSFIIKEESENFNQSKIKENKSNINNILRVPLVNIKSKNSLKMNNPLSSLSRNQKSSSNNLQDLTKQTYVFTEKNFKKNVHLTCFMKINFLLSLFPKHFKKNSNRKIKIFTYLIDILFNYIDVNNIIRNMNLLEKLSFCLLGEEHVRMINSTFNLYGFLYKNDLFKFNFDMYPTYQENFKVTQEFYTKIINNVNKFSNF